MITFNSIYINGILEVESRRNGGAKWWIIEVSGK